MLRKAGGKIGHAMRAGPTMAALFGSSTRGISPTMLRALRRRLARATRHMPKSTQPTLFSFTQTGMHDGDPAHTHHANLLGRWAEFVWHEESNLQVAWSVLGGAASVLLRARNPGACVTGPASALILTCARLNWQVITPTVLCTHE
eukprot:1091065-Amphidinium_carterae.1